MAGYHCFQRLPSCWQGTKHKVYFSLVIFYFKTPLILSYLPNCKLVAFRVIYRKTLWSLSLKWNEIIPALPTLGKFYVKSPGQAEMTKHWDIFRDFISLPDNDKVDFVLSEGKSYLIYHQLPPCHQPHFTFFKQPQLGDADYPLLWGWSTAKCLTNHGTLSLSATCFFIVIKQDVQQEANCHNFIGERSLIYTTLLLGARTKSIRERGSL